MFSSIMFNLYVFCVLAYYVNWPQVVKHDPVAFGVKVHGFIFSTHSPPLYDADVMRMALPV